MEFFFNRFKALAVTVGFSFWFFIISSALGLFSFELFAIFVIVTIIITQILSVKLSRGLEIFAIINTKVFLGILFIFVISIYGVLFRILNIDLLRLKKQETSYWLEDDKIKKSTLMKQF